MKIFIETKRKRINPWGRKSQSFLKLMNIIKSSYPNTKEILKAENQTNITRDY